MNTPESFDPEERIVVPPLNFAITVRPTDDGSAKATVETWTPGEFNVVEHMTRIADYRRTVGFVEEGQTPDAVFDLLLRAAAGCARRLSETTGVPWKPPVWFRALAWWRGVRSRNSRQA